MSKHTQGPGANLSLGAIASALEPFYAGLSDTQLLAIQQYLTVLLRWNRSINLTALEDPMEILARHFGESVFAASILKLGGSRLADVGTGPGFPGLPMKIAAPGIYLSLIEPNLKKCAFLTEVVQALGLADVAIIKKRYDETSIGDALFDFVCSRALGDYSNLLPWASRSLKPGGRVALWLGTDESIRVGRRSEFIWDSPVPIPESRRRVILLGRKPADQ
jgi:16S rRNA (guanine527-N7)-methyltransferase